ncbi:MAG: hypothetical protein LCH57_12615 [Proteobacteria bacterium]|nr:hypothetical protein [Pseudomonadota bacterium]
MLDKRSRYFVRHRLILRPKRNQGAPLPLTGDAKTMSAFSVLKKRVDAKTASIIITGGDTLRITAIEHRKADDMVVLVFRRRNPNAATQIYENKKSEALREADRTVDEDPAASTHLFISTKVHPGAVASYRAIMEDVPEIGTSYMKLLLDEIIKGQEYDYKDSRNVDGKTSTKVDLFGVPSDTLKQAVTKNGFGFIELVKSPDLKGLDTEGLTPKPEKFRIYTKRGSGVGGNTLFERVFTWAKAHGWDDVSVQVRENGKTKVVKVGREADAATTLFVRADIVKVASDIPSCSATINNELVAEAKKMFADDASWK